jgi:hypothetical protein
MRQHQRLDRHSEPAEDPDQPANGKGRVLQPRSGLDDAPEGHDRDPDRHGQPDGGPQARRFPWAKAKNTISRTLATRPAMPVVHARREFMPDHCPPDR